MMSARITVCVLVRANANLLAIYDFYVCANALVALRAVKSHLGSIDCAFCVNDAACFSLLSGLNVLVNDVSALNDYLTLFGGYCDYLTLNALGVTGKYYYSIICFNMQFCHFQIPPD